MTEPPIFRFHEGDSPLLISIPHAGTHVPAEISTRLTDEARELPDTDSFVDRLYGFAPHIGASVISATHSRYVIDLNRPPDDASLYPGRFGTGLLPEDLLSGNKVYRQGEEPGEDEKAARLARYWQPYHEKITHELSRLREKFGYALLWDAHSIKSQVSALFEGRLPAYNFGLGGGKSCALPVKQAFPPALARFGIDSFVFDGRFKGGYITRHYGKPEQGVHAVQLELVQAAYMDEAANRYDEAKAAETAPVLRALLEAYLSLKP